MEHTDTIERPPEQLAGAHKAIKDVLRLLGGHVGVASELGYPDRRNVWPWTSLRIPLPAEKAPALELATARKGEMVPVERLCPNAPWTRVYDQHWPHPHGRPVLDVARDLARGAA